METSPPKGKVKIRELSNGEIEIYKSSDTVIRDFREKPLYDGSIFEPYDIKARENYI